jgi:hypothetical protein
MAREKKHDDAKLADIEKIKAKKKARRLAKRRMVTHKVKQVKQEAKAKVESQVS